MPALRSGLAAWRHWSGQALEDRDLLRDRREAFLLLATIGFVLINAVAYSLVRDSTILWAHLYAPLIWASVTILAHLTLRVFRPRRDPFLLPTVTLLAGWSLLLQDRLAPNFLGRQTLWFVLATVALLAVAILPRSLQPLRQYRYVLLLGGLILLAITLIFGVNPSGSGAALWLPVPFPFLGEVYFQPSELLKLLLVVFLASYFTEREPLYLYRRATARNNGAGKPGVIRSFIHYLPFLGPLLLMWGFTLLLLVWQQDLGAAALFFIVFVALLYLATGEMRYVWSGLVMLLLAGVLAFFVFDGVVAPRVLSWLNPWPNVSDRAFQIVQSLYAQAAGGLFGRGIGQGHPDYIPVVHSDFALAAIAEEWGLIGSLTVVACFGLLSARGLRIAVLSIRGPRPNYFHAYLAAGLVVLVSTQTFLIMGGVTRLLPLTGITLPFTSYGGSSLLVSSIIVGLLLYLSAKVEPISPTPPGDAGLALRLERLGLVILIVFAVISLTLAYWSVVRADSLMAREDNPRLIEAERRVQRGQILANDETVLAESVGSPDNLTRVYPLASAGGPAVGYYSLRFGAAGIESAYNAHLRGQSEAFWQDATRRLLHIAPVGGDVRLTLDADLQSLGNELMDSAGITGGLVLLELTEIGGESVADVRAMVSRPGYNPNRIDEEFETLSTAEPGPLVNRAAQGRYQPGLILQPLIVASAVDDGVLSLDAAIDDPFLPVALNGQVQRCATPRTEGDTRQYSWADMAALRCPAPLQALGQKLGGPALEKIFARFGLHQAPDLPIPTEGEAATITDAGLAAIGQEALTVTPLQVALAMSTLANDGLLPAPRLVDALADAGATWEAQPAGTPGDRPALVVAPGTTSAIRAGWPTNGDAAEFAVSVLAGPDNSRNAWYVGLAPAQNPRFVLALVVEGVSDSSSAESIGRQLLRRLASP